MRKGVLTVRPCEKRRRPPGRPRSIGAGLDLGQGRPGVGPHAADRAPLRPNQVGRGGTRPFRRPVRHRERGRSDPGEIAPVGWRELPWVAALRSQIRPPDSGRPERCRDPVEGRAACGSGRSPPASAVPRSIAAAAARTSVDRDGVDLGDHLPGGDHPAPGQDLAGVALDAAARRLQGREQRHFQLRLGAGDLGRRRGRGRPARWRRASRRRVRAGPPRRCRRRCRTGRNPRRASGRPGSRRRGRGSRAPPARAARSGRRRAPARTCAARSSRSSRKDRPGRPITRLACSSLRGIRRSPPL